MSKIIPDEEIMEIVQSVFSPKIIKNTPDKDIYIQTEDGNDCVTFNLYPDKIYIETLQKCGTTSGTELLKMFDTLAKRMPNIKYIGLQDASDIEICEQSIHLSMLKILTNGQSWYNSHGYFSEYHDSEISHNEAIINMEYEKFIDIVYKRNLELFPLENSIEVFIKKIKLREKIIDKISNLSIERTLSAIENESLQHNQNVLLKYQDIINNYETYIDTELNKHIKEQEAEINTGIRLFPDVNKTVKEYFNYVWRDITSNIREKGCDDKETIEKCIWLSKFIYKIGKSQILQYNGKKLIKMVGPKGGSKSKKSKSKKSKSKKSKSNKNKSKKSKSKKSKSKRSKKY
jgi:hypothetical protein